MVILIVEDEVLIGLALQVVLFFGGHHVIGLAASADEALRLAAAEPPELAFVDINIRGDSDGIAVARALTERHGTSCILSDGSGRPSEKRQGCRPGRHWQAV